MKLLFIDDSKTCRVLIENIFKEYNLDMAINGEDAINKIKEHKYDIIMTDMEMPIKNGTDVLNYVKSNNIQTVTIVMTALSMKGDEEKFISLGFDYYISKPINIKSVKKLIRNIQQNGY